jgi:Ice-binding-like
MNQLFELFHGAKFGVARVRSIRAGVPAPTSHTAGGSMMKLGAFLLCAAFTLSPITAKSHNPPPTTLQPVNLGSAATYAVFANTGVTNVGATMINGNLGSSIPSVTGFSGEDSGCCGVVNGTIDDTDTGPESSAAAHAAASLGIAIKDAKGRPCPAAQVPAGCALASELSGLTFTPGVYTSAVDVNISGPVYLSGPGVYIFQIAGGLIVNGGTVVLEGVGSPPSGPKATAAKVFWVTTQATLNTTLPFAGTILSTTSVTFPGLGGVLLTGRALAQTDVTFAAADTVTLPANCTESAGVWTCSAP